VTIWDCFPYWREHRLVTARQELWKRSGLDVRLVAFVGDRTHRGNPKPPSPAPPKGVRVVEVTLTAADDWGRERQQRDAVLQLVPEMDPDDLVLLCDADELVDPSATARIYGRAERGMTSLEMWCYLFDTDWRTARPWLQAKACTARHLADLRGDVRATWTYQRAQRAGWHFSYQDDVDGKLAAFAHAECDTPEHRQLVDRCRVQHLDFEGHPLVYQPLTGVVAEVLTA
jgi:hypothetical protein